MDENAQNRYVDTCRSFDISDEDILKAMKDINGYLDITPRDFKILYRLAYTRAVERLTLLLKAKDIMTVRVFFAKKDTLSEEVAYMMATEGIAGVPVVDDGGKVVGVISEKDFLFHMGTKDTKSFMDIIAHCLRSKECVALSMRKQKAEDIMTSPVIAVRPETPVSEIANILTQKGINRVPVTDQEGKLMGIIARADVVQSSCALTAQTENEN